MTDKPDLGALDPVDLAQRLIRCPSVTPEEGGALDLLERVLGGLGFTCHRLAFSEPGAAEVENLYARLGAAGPNFCYAGHTDVVPVGDAKAWSVDPFAAEIVDGTLYGRGAADMKGSIAAFLGRHAGAADQPLGEVDRVERVRVRLVGHDGGPSSLELYLRRALSRAAAR